MYLNNKSLYNCKVVKKLLVYSKNNILIDVNTCKHNVVRYTHREDPVNWIPHVLSATFSH